jgi:amidase
MQRVSREHTFTAFAPTLAPVCCAEPGEWLWVETWDCFGGEVLAGKTRDEVTPGLANPTTGPIALRGAEPGDMVRITIAAIEPAARGFVMAEGQCRFVDVVDGLAVFSESVRLPLRPMIGVIGVTPTCEPVETRLPGVHGGNMDTVDVKPGAQVFLRAQLEEALVGVGDVHACQGDGEVCGQGIEIPAEVLLRLDLEPRPLPAESPYVIVDGRLSLIASAPTFEECIHAAVDDMTRVVADRMRVTPAEARMLISLTGDVRISQIVNPLMTARVVMPILW